MERRTRIAMKMLPATTRTQSLKSAPVGTFGFAPAAATSSWIIMAVTSSGERSADGGDLPSFGAVRGDGPPQCDGVGLGQLGLCSAGVTARPGDGRGGAALVVVTGEHLPVAQRLEADRAVQAGDRGTRRGYRGDGCVGRRVRLEERLRVLLGQAAQLLVRRTGRGHVRRQRHGAV